MYPDDCIMQSLLDTDLYKFTMAQAVLHHFPTAMVEYKFKCRNEDVKLGYLRDDVRQEIYNGLCNLIFRVKELDYLKTLRFIKPDFIEFLRGVQLQRDFIKIENVEGDLEITIKGPWFHTIWYEVPVLAIINELYFRRQIAQHGYDKIMAIGKEKLQKKIDYLKDHVDSSFKLSDFGARRRFSLSWQDEMVGILKKQLPENFQGTSNVYLAMKHDVKPIGTMAHEWICAGQNLGPRLIDSQKFMLQKWAEEYRGDLGIALSDTLGFNTFLKDFDMYFAKLFDGCRHDSGDPIVWMDKLVLHYRELGIDPTSKIAVFSDGLTPERVVKIWQEAHHRIKTSFGIGTNLTNDIVGTPINIVIKLTEINGRPVAKLSDTPGKGMCKDATYVKYLKSVVGIKG